MVEDHDILTISLDMERHSIPLKEYMVLTQFYPLSGVNGVDESSVYGNRVDEYRSARNAEAKQCTGLHQETLFVDGLV